MLLWLLLHAAIAAAGTEIARRYAWRRNLLDEPGDRRSHRVPTPRGGGVGIVIALMVAACVLAWRHPQQIVLIAAYLAGLLLVAGVGLIDDHRPLSPWLRLAVQCVAALVLALGMAGTWGDAVLALVALGGVLVLTNVWNFMDGINGIAASQALLVAAGLAWISGGTMGWLALALAAACAGFLPFNFPRARIFLGDVGSGALGFTLATIAVAALPSGGVHWPLLLLPFSTFLVDSGMTLVRRIGRGERWWTPHATHAYQRWAARLNAHTTVTLAYAGWTAAAWVAVWWLRTSSIELATTFSLVWLVASMALWTALQYAYSAERGNLVAQSEYKDKE